MSIDLSKANIGDLYLGNNGQVFRIDSFCKEPTITMKNVVNTSKVGGGVSSLNMEPFVPISELNKSSLLTILESLASSCNGLVYQKIDLMNQLADSKLKIVDMKEAELERREQENQS